MFFFFFRFGISIVRTFLFQGYFLDPNNFLIVSLNL
uniref:Uncharacterized protein n=1 Tax=Rhizophora mucronata TaxID=61149 RepID=A0A2P2NDW3_RHIMU